MEIEAIRLARVASRAPVDVESLGDFLIGRRPGDSIALVQDTHGDPRPFDQLISIVPNGIDWIGIETNPSRADLFNQFNEASDPDEVDRLKGELQTVLTQGLWREVPDKISDLLTEAKNNRVQIFPIDAPTAYTRDRGIFERLAIATRNLHWAKSVPESGSGVIFGGGAHFESPQRGTVQDYLRSTHPEHRIVLIEDSVPKRGRER